MSVLERKFFLDALNDLNYITCTMSTTPQDLKEFEMLYNEITAMYKRIPDRQYHLLYAYYAGLTPTSKALARSVMADGHFARMRKVIDDFRGDSPKPLGI